jgi:DNA-binding PadR family transcriptional regulator
MMSTIDLIILGILTESPMNAYEIIQYISERQIGNFLKISDPAIYKSCKRLLHDGLVDGTSVKEGNQPNKTVYRINPDGEFKFNQLMVHYSSNLNNWNIEFNAFMWNLEKVDKQQGLQMLANLGDLLREKESWFKDHVVELLPYIPFSARMVLTQYSMMTTTLVAWIEGATEEYERLDPSSANEFSVAEVNRIHGH